MAQKQYPFRYEKDSAVDEWLQHQQNKRESLRLLVMAAIKQYGNADLRDLFTGDITIEKSVPPTKPVKHNVTRVADDSFKQQHNSVPEKIGNRNVLDMLSSL